MALDSVTQNTLQAVRDLPEVRKSELEATLRVLGDTITISEQDWQSPSRLPGWTRAHVASHLARNAEALIRSVDATLNGRRALMYDSRTDAERAIERGSERSGLELQIDLDTTAGRLNRRFDVLDTVPGQLLLELYPGHSFRADLLPCIRLNEVVLHHIDLDCGFEIDDVDPVIARWLVEWNALLGTDQQSYRLVCTSGLEMTVGTSPTVTIRGDDILVLGWLTGRLTRQRCQDLGFPDWSPAWGID